MTCAFPKISIIILTYNRSIDDILECLSSVRSMSYPDFEIILVDNSTNSPSKFDSTRFRDIHLIDVTGRVNLGASGGRNLGIKHSTGKYIFFVDDDVIVDKDNVSELRKIVETNRSIGITGPLMYSYDHPSEIWFYNNYISQDSNEEIVDVPIVVGGALFINREVMYKIGLFDESYFFYHEEWDLCYRAQEAGYRTVCATKASCWHKVPIDESGKLLVPKRAYYWHRNFFIFAGRHFKTINSAFRFLFKHLVYYGNNSFPCYFVVFALKRKRLDVLKAYFRGILDGLVWLAKLRY